MSGERVILGRISGAHGLAGEVRIATFTAAPETIADYGPLTDETGAAHTITSLRAMKGGVIARLAGILDRTAAEALRGRTLSVDRAALPQPEGDEFYHADLIGLAAVDPSGAALGEIVAVPSYGAGDMLEIRATDRRTTLLVPFTLTNVPHVDIAARRVTVVPPAYEEDPS